jgi:hypothetical protein
MTKNLTIGSHEWLAVRQRKYNELVSGYRLGDMPRASHVALSIHAQVIAIIDALSVNEGGRAKVTC